ncbi:hypothetical protein GPALN_009788 [Globodera pallida]|nr:hypothetical protein GPALN_009788 [Globodera pallida]
MREHIWERTAMPAQVCVQQKDIIAEGVLELESAFVRAVCKCGDLVHPRPFVPVLHMGDLSCKVAALSNELTESKFSFFVCHNIFACLIESSMGTFKPRQGLDYEKNLSLLVKHSRVQRSVANGRPGSCGITAEGILEVDLACVRAGRKSGNLGECLGVAIGLIFTFACVVTGVSAYGIPLSTDVLRLRSQLRSFKMT